MGTPTTMPTRRSLQLLARLAAFLCFALLFPGRASANDALKTPANKPPEKHVFLDLETKRFDAPLREDAGNVIAISTIAPKKASLTIAYWRLKKGESCPEPGPELVELTPSQRERATFRSFAPHSPVDEDRAHFVTNIGPLLYPERYCFHIGGTVATELSGHTKFKISHALEQALDKAAKEMLDAEPTACTDAYAKRQDDAAALVLCVLEDRFAKAVAAEKELTELRVLVPGSSDPASLTEALHLILESSEATRKRVVGALSAGFDRTDRINELKAELRAKYDAAKDVTLHPLAGVSAADLKAWARKAGVSSRTHKKIGKASTAEELDDVVHEPAVLKELLEKKVWEAAPKEKESALQFVFLSEEKPRTPGQRLEAVAIKELLRAEVTRATTEATSLEDTLDALQKAEKAIQDAGLKKAYGKTDADAAPGRGTVEELTGAIAGMALALTLEKKTKDDFDKLTLTQQGKPSPLAAELTKSMVALERSTGVGSFSAEPDYAQRFPLYITADVGLALILFPVDEKPRTRPDLVPYFGLNIYFIPVDKEERLREVVRPGRNFLRRFSVMAGISLIEPRIQKDALNIEGVLGQQVLLTGVGLRPTDYIRLGAGATHFTTRSRNPLSERREYRAAPYVSISVDLDVFELIRTRFNRAQASVSG